MSQVTVNKIELAPDKRLRVVSAYNATLVERFRALKEKCYALKLKGAGWYGDAWYFPINVYADLIEAMNYALAGTGYDVDPAVVVAHNAWVLETAQKQAEETAYQQRTAKLRQEALARLRVDRPLADGRILFAHQQEAVKVLVQAGKFILADDMGLGKSLTALVSAAAFNLPIHVLAPAGLCQNWKNESAGSGIPLDAIHSWAKVPKEIAGEYVLIADEAHYAQSIRSARTQAFLKLTKQKNCIGVFLLTGTPIKNGQPQHYYPLLVAVDHELTKDKTFFDVHFCDAAPTRWSKWDTSGARNLVELYERTRNVMLRRTKDKVLDLPEKIRQLRYIDLDAEQEKVYRTSRASDVEIYRRTKLTKMLGDSMGDMSEDEINEAFENIAEDDLLALSILMADRKAASRAKTKSAIELAEEVVEQGGQIVLFTMFKDTAEAVAGAFGAQAATITSDTKHRQAIVDDFQAGRIKVIASTFGAGNVGFTLTAAQTVVLVDRPFTPGDAIQAEDRLHRIGQKNTVYAIWLQCDGVDKSIDTLLSRKEIRISKILEGKAKTLRGVGDGILEIAREVSEQMKLEV